MDNYSMYQQLSGMNLGATSDDQFRSMGFSNGRQGAIDFMAQARNQYDPMTIANNAQQMQVQANQPAIATLNTQKQTLADSYQTLLDSVLQSGTVSENQAQLGENNLLAQRGIVNSSPLYNQQMSSALLPVESSYKSLAANIGEGSAQDLNALAAQIANLQAGNVGQALSFAGNIAGLNQQASLLPAQMALLQGQAKQTQYVPIPNYGIFNTSSNNLLGGFSQTGLSPTGRTIVGQY